MTKCKTSGCGCHKYSPGPIRDFLHMEELVPFAESPDTPLKRLAEMCSRLGHGSDDFVYVPQGVTVIDLAPDDED